MPTLIYALLKSNAYILIFAFIFHFIMRAFWVGMVGLLSVYPKGVDYENLPKQYSNELKELIKARLSSTEQFILDLDKRCSLIFSLAFTLVITFVGVSFMYLFITAVYNGVSLLLPAPVFEKYGELIVFGLLFIILLPTIFISVLSLPTFKGKPKYEKIKAELQWRVQNYLMPLIGPVVYRMSVIFVSNSKFKNKYAFAVFFGALTAGMFFVVMRYRVAGELWNNRDYFNANSEYHYLDANLYENLRISDKPIPYLTIQADVIREPFLRLYLAYPKRIDTRLKNLCPEPNLPKNLKAEERAKKQSEYLLACFARFNKIYLNDSIKIAPEFIFHKHPQTGEKGLLTYIDLSKAKVGKNYLKIMRPNYKNPQKDTTFYVVPYWYYPKAD